MLYKMLIGIFLLHLATAVYADLCDLTDENFPRDTCSFSEPSFNKNALRFGHIDKVVENGSIIRLGANLYVLDENVVINDTSNSDCAFNSLEIDSTDEEKYIAFTLDGDSLRAPRIINQLWLLECELDQAR